MAHLFSEKSAAPYLIPVIKNGAVSIEEHADLSWPELDAIVQYESPTTALYFLPPEAYLELFFLYTCDQNQMPVIMGSAYNLPWVVKALAENTTELIVSNDHIAPYLLKEMHGTTSAKILTTLILVGNANEHTKRVEAELPAQTEIKRLSHPLL